MLRRLLHWQRGVRLRAAKRLYDRDVTRLLSSGLDHDALTQALVARTTDYEHECASILKAR